MTDIVVLDGGMGQELLHLSSKPEATTAHLPAWAGQGGSLIGGCCEVGPAHIEAVHDRLLAQGHRPVRLTGGSAG